MNRKALLALLLIASLVIAVSIAVGCSGGKDMVSGGSSGPNAKGATGPGGGGTGMGGTGMGATGAGGSTGMAAKGGTGAPAQGSTEAAPAGD